MLGHLLPFVASALLWVTAATAFGVTASGTSYTVDTNAGLVFTIDGSSGDVTSLKWNGVETQATDKNSQISSGIGATCTYFQGGNSNNYILFTCVTSTLTQYYLARYNDPALHMMTYTSAEPSVGELRFIARLKQSVLPNGSTPATVYGASEAIEGSDVYLVGSQTRSKFYSSRQFIDDQVHCATGTSIAACMIIPGTGYEASSGGPFFRDIDLQLAGDSEVYFYMNSGHEQTESFRQGLHGPYALWYTNGSTPSTFTYSFWEQFSSNITGFVTQAGRGRVTGTATGWPSAYASYISIGWSNSNNEYWVRTDTSGAFTSPYMKPGTYTMTLYRMELAIGTSSVTVSAGGTTSANIASTETTPSYIWIIGAYDGTPRGFLNADKIETMHPSDARMSSWTPTTFTVGSSSDSSFPMALFQAFGSQTISFNLTSSQTGARTVQIATTSSFAGGRPVITVNSWTGSTPSAPTNLNSRGVTRGTWRGNNILYSWSVPSGYLVTGTNTLTISVASGSSGDDYLSPNFVLDSLWLY